MFVLFSILDAVTHTPACTFTDEYGFRYLNGGRPSAEDAAAQAARDLKRINSSVTTILYLNEFLDYPWCVRVGVTGASPHVTSC